jgi:hypothetical protein
MQFAIPKQNARGTPSATVDVITSIPGCAGDKVGQSSSDGTVNRKEITSTVVQANQHRRVGCWLHHGQREGGSCSPNAYVAVKLKNR